MSAPDPKDRSSECIIQLVTFDELEPCMACDTEVRIGVGSQSTDARERGEGCFDVFICLACVRRFAETLGGQRN